MNAIAYLSLVLACVAAGCAAPGRGAMPAVAVVALQGDGAVAEAAPADATAITVATFNVYGLRYREKVRADLRAMAWVDVWLLQEVVVGEADVRELADVLPPGAWHVAVARVNRASGAGRWEAQAIVSRYPLRDVTTWPLRAGGGKARAALVATVDTPGGAVRAVNTDHEVSFLDVAYANRGQVNDLSARLRDARDARVVVGGDFNSAGNLFRIAGASRNVADVSRAMGAAGLLPLPARAASAATFRGPFGPLQLDHLYVRGTPCEAWGTGPSAGSDHRPVWARLSFRGRPAAAVR